MPCPMPTVWPYPIQRTQLLDAELYEDHHMVRNRFAVFRVGNRSTSFQECDHVVTRVLELQSCVVGIYRAYLCESAQLLKIVNVALNFECSSMRAPDAYLRITVSADLKVGLPKASGLFIPQHPSQKNAFPSGVLVIGGSISVDFEPILSLVVVGLGHDQCDVEILPYRRGMLSYAVALRSG